MDSHRSWWTIFCLVASLVVSSFDYYQPTPVPQPAPVKVGVQIEEISKASLAFLMPGSFIRKEVFWDEIEFEKGKYNWAKLDHELALVKGYPLILIVRNTPFWYSSGKKCSPPAYDYFSKYIDFVARVIDRYRPWGIEIWNEPEAQTSGDLDRLMGCFPFTERGGFYYADLVKSVWYNLKYRYRDTKFIAGAMLVNADEAFWVGAYERQLRGHVDYISFHSYARYEADDSRLLEQKIKLIRGYYPDEPLILSETSLLGKIDTVDFQEKQANYFKYVVGIAEANNIPVVIWFTLCCNQWENRDLVGPGGEKRQAWYEYADYLSITSSQ